MILGAIAALTMLGCERHNFDDTKILHGDHGHHDEHYGDDAHHGDDHKDGDKKHDDHAKEEGQGEKKAKGKSKGEKKAKGGGKKARRRAKLATWACRIFRSGNSNFFQLLPSRSVVRGIDFINA